MPGFRRRCSGATTTSQPYAHQKAGDGDTKQQSVHSVNEIRREVRVGVNEHARNVAEDQAYLPSLVLALIFARVFACSTDEIFTLEVKP